MADTFFSRLTERALAIDSLLCVGLDPHPELVGAAGPAAALRWCLDRIDATAAEACAFKPNSAFFEGLGPEGWDVLRRVISAAGRHAPVILDAKRGDIASSGQRYAHAAFHELGADAITLSPYLGRDSLDPFLEDPARGAFLLCKTSNPGSGDLQDLTLATGDPLYLAVATAASRWNRNDNLGLVVGATYPEALARVRRAAPDLWFLAPGIGEQGGDLAVALGKGLRQDGLGMLVAVSRQISQADRPDEEAERIRRAINHERVRPREAAGHPPPLVDLARGLLDTGCVRFGKFTLKSGLESPIYIDLRRLASYPELLRQAAGAYLLRLGGLRFDRLAAIPYAALPIGSAVALAGGFSMIYPRLEVKDHGTRRQVEGEFSAGETAVVIDDLTTTGLSKFEAIERLRAEGLRVKDVVVLIDRQSGAAEALASEGVLLHAVFTLTELLGLWEADGRVSPHDLRAVRDFLG